MEAFGVIYLLVNGTNDMEYVGQTTKTAEERFKYHKSCNKSYIGNAIRAHGAENFIIAILKECTSKEELDCWEKYFIKARNTKVPNGYNLTDGGEGIIGLKRTPEHVAKVAASKTGKPLSKEHRAKIGASISGEKNPFFGKTHTNEVRAMLSEIHLGETPYKNLIAELREGQLLCLDLAKFLEINSATLSEKMRGKINFISEQIAKIEELLQKPAAYLFERDENFSFEPATDRRKSPYKNLIAELDTRGFSFPKVAELIGSSKSSIYKKMRGERNFKDSEKKKLAEILGKPIEYLLQRNE